ncbi:MULTISPECIES: TetR/AcrR family transcriptional regulator [unclassified Caulobacter]|jgi:AcrR family transcriptional regulator|uniref:TetR/AcrR family transcriptional regulator n=1 Tax=unclassified Caulobacter TaxID=2648921 RepID=UPI000645D091|nr:MULTISPECIES: TetR/AcrR family transcriptional regulator [unclassified Caulobacter]KQV56648.1 TetR family transcriptional regulator [Caulobacter sp. Root342]KQV72285.1 TetR family transcriptional regulator [Caulobacter sp. Root343]
MTIATAESRPYHHGDLSRALVDAARAILEREGPSALSLRAVAREAGVSPAAPYHHFKDKAELLEAVAHEGWHELDVALSTARASTPDARVRMTNLGVAYVCFARDNPALYRVMYDRSRDKDALPDQLKDDGAYCQVRNTIDENAGGQATEIDLELATIAAWCAGHGLAEMIGFKQFAPLKELLGGEEAFLRAVFEHLGMFAKFTAPAQD